MPADAPTCAANGLTNFVLFCLKDGWTKPVCSGIRLGWFYNSFEDYLDGKHSRFGIVDELDDFVAESPFRENRVSRWCRHHEVGLIHTADETKEEEIKEQIAAGKALEVLDRRYNNLTAATEQPGRPSRTMEWSVSCLTFRRYDEFSHAHTL